MQICGQSSAASMLIALGSKRMWPRLHEKDKSSPDLLNFLFSGLTPMIETPVKMSCGFHNLLMGVPFVTVNSIVIVLPEHAIVSMQVQAAGHLSKQALTGEKQCLQKRMQGPLQAHACSLARGANASPSQHALCCCLHTALAQAYQRVVASYSPVCLMSWSSNVGLNTRFSMLMLNM